MPFRNEAATDTDVLRDRRRGLVVLLLALLPALLAVWIVPGFVTQDGPAHLYNAHILAESFRADSPFRDVFQVRWDPLPNLAGHLVLMGLISVLTPRAADAVMLTGTLAGFAAAMVWLRGRVAGRSGMPTIAVLAALLALNLPWLLGFTNFLLGACLIPVTLGVWWGGRDRLGIGRVLGMSLLLVLGYFCHLVSLGLTVGALGVLAVLTPGAGWARRLAGTLAAVVPLVPLAIVYRRLMRGGGAIEPEWLMLDDPWTLRAWKERLGWVDPLTLGRKLDFPFVEHSSPAFALLAPSVWCAAGLGVLLIVTLRNAWNDPEARARLRERRGWVVLAILLVFGGIFGPDTLGPKHGHYLTQRLLLMGLVMLTPALSLSPTRRATRIIATALLGVALAVQSAVVWDYALRADRQVRPYLAAKPYVGRGQRVGSLALGLSRRYRANPLLHLDCLLGVGNGNVIWGNYEAAFYYFPVQIRPEVPHPPILTFEAISIRDDPADAPQRAARWRRLLDAHHDQIDVLLIQGSDPRIDRINARWFHPVPVFQNRAVRVLRHRRRDEVP